MLVHGKKDANGWWYQYKNGGYPTNREVEINGYIYYFNRSGYMVRGWQKLVNTGNIIIQKHIMDVQKDLCENLHGLETIM